MLISLFRLLMKYRFCLSSMLIIVLRVCLITSSWPDIFLIRRNCAQYSLIASFEGGFSAYLDYHLLQQFNNPLSSARNCSWKRRLIVPRPWSVDVDVVKLTHFMIGAFQLRMSRDFAACKLVSLSSLWRPLVLALRRTSPEQMILDTCVDL